MGQWSLSCPWLLHLRQPTFARASDQGTLSCFKLCISKLKFCSYAWICWTPNPGSCIGVSCNLIAISNASTWVEIFCCDRAILRCGVIDATNHTECYTSDSVMFTSRIVLFSLWYRSHEVSLGIIAISLNPMIDCISDFIRLNLFFNLVWISTVPTFEISLQ